MKHIILYLLLLLFPYISRAQQNIENNQHPVVSIQSTSAENFIDQLSINHRKAVYDPSDNLYLQTLATSYKNQTNLTAVVSFTFKSSGNGYQLKINNQTAANGSSFTFKDFKEGKIFDLEIQDKNGKSVASTKLAFTFLPIAEITGKNFSRNSYTSGSFRLTDANYSNTGSILSAKFRWRGNVASSKQKKAYNVKITDEKGKSKDVSFFGLREDNDWILDAMAIDPARMRNRVSTDLWNDFSTAPYFFHLEPEAINGTRGHFVEVFLNGRYAGIYCMTEKIDRKQLKLKKVKKGNPASVRGVLYKAEQWSYSLLMGHDPDKLHFPLKKAAPYSNQKDEWDGWELKHPDLGDGEPIDWKPLFDAVNVPASVPDPFFEADVAQYFDLPVMLDYYLFIELMLATDNHGKNLFLHCYNIQENRKLSITPWDMDGTWGRRWDGSKELTQNAFQDFTRFLWNYEHGENTLYKRLMELNCHQWNEKLAQRYGELRGSFFGKESLTNRFHQYHQLFKTSGADQREYKRWNGVDGVKINFEEEMAYLDRWIADRLTKLDRVYGYSPTGTATPSIQQKDLQIGGGAGKIVIRTNHPVVLHIYKISGQQTGTYRQPAGISEISISQPGLYIVNGQKVIVW